MAGIGRWLSGLSERVQAVAPSLGGPGLFLVAFLDSSVLPLPGALDLLVVWMVIQHNARFVFYALSATLGSMAGCLSLYYVARKGGDALVASRFRSDALDRARATLQRHGILAVLIPSLLPPPAPFKIFVLLAGVAEISVTRFAIAIAIGRGGRYFAEAVLALWFGDRALDFVHRNSRTVLVAVLVLILAGAAGRWFRGRQQRMPNR